jgi:predicted ABC-type ATPase
MKLNHLIARTIPTDPYRSVVLMDGILILAECNGSGKDEVAAEIAKRCNNFDAMLDALEIIAAGNTDPDRMVGLAQQALKTLNGETK